MSSRTYIFPGRFQPFHNDHMRAVQEFTVSYREMPLVIAVVRPLPPGELVSDDYKGKGDEHFLRERNPFSVEFTLRMVEAVARHRFPESLLVTLIPRPSSGYVWRIISSLLPAPRTWLIPARNEQWDEEKARFFTEMGDEVLRIPMKRRVSGQIVRQCLKTAAGLREARKLVPAEVGALLEWLP